MEKSSNNIRFQCSWIVHEIEIFCGDWCNQNFLVEKDGLQQHSWSSWWFQPIWKVVAKLDHFPKWGENKHVWNHQLVFILVDGRIKCFWENVTNGKELFCRKIQEAFAYGMVPSKAKLSSFQVWRNTDALNMNWKQKSLAQDHANFIGSHILHMI